VVEDVIILFRYFLFFLSTKIEALRNLPIVKIPETYTRMAVGVSSSEY
jgi:hypothetical protein